MTRPGLLVVYKMKPQLRKRAGPRAFLRDPSQDGLSQLVPVRKIETSVNRSTDRPRINLLGGTGSVGDRDCGLSRGRSGGGWPCCPDRIW